MTAGVVTAHLDDVPTICSTRTPSPTGSRCATTSASAPSASTPGWRRAPGDQAIERHDEAPEEGGSERPRGALRRRRGGARFTVDGEELDAPAGTLVFVSDPSSRARRSRPSRTRPSSWSARRAASRSSRRTGRSAGCASSAGSSRGFFATVRGTRPAWSWSSPERRRASGARPRASSPDAATRSRCSPATRTGSRRRRRGREPGRPRARDPDRRRRRGAGRGGRRAGRRASSATSTSGSTTRWRRSSRRWEIEADEFRRVTEVTYLGQVYGDDGGAQADAPARPGTIVQVGSALAYRGIPLQAPTAAPSTRSAASPTRCAPSSCTSGSGVRITTVHLPALNTTQFGLVRRACRAAAAGRAGLPARGGRARDRVGQRAPAAARALGRRLDGR